MIKGIDGIGGSGFGAGFGIIAGIPVVVAVAPIVVAVIPGVVAGGIVTVTGVTDGI
jgi:hypothetical protein